MSHTNSWYLGKDYPREHQSSSAGYSSRKQADVTAMSSSDYDVYRWRKLEQAINNEMEIIDLVAEELRLSVEESRRELQRKMSTSNIYDDLCNKAFHNLRWVRSGVLSYNFENVGLGNSELLLKALSILLSSEDTLEFSTTVDRSLARRCIEDKFSRYDYQKLQDVLTLQTPRLRSIKTRIKQKEDSLSSFDAQAKSASQTNSDQDIKKQAVEVALYKCKQALDIFLHHQTEKITEASTLLKSAYDVLLNPRKSIESGLYSTKKGGVSRYRDSSEKDDIPTYRGSSNRSREDELREQLNKDAEQISALNVEIADLKKQLEEKCRKIEDLSLTASYTCLGECTEKCLAQKTDREADFQQQIELLKHSERKLKEQLKERGNKRRDPEASLSKSGPAGELQEELERYNKQQTERDADVQSLQQGSSELQDELESYKSQLAERDGVIKSLEQGRLDMDEKNAKVQLALEKMHQEFDTLKQEKRRDEEEAIKLDEKIKRLTDQMSAHQNKVKTKEERSSKQDVALQEAMVRVSQLLEKVDKLEREKKSCEDEMAKLKDDLSKQASDYLDQISKQQVEMDEMKREKKSYEDEIAKVNCDMTNQERNYLEQISRQQVEMDEEIKRQKKLAQQATDNSRRLQDKVEELEGILEVRESELQDSKDEFSKYKYKLLGSAITKESANYQDLNDTLRPGKVIEMHKDLREGDCLDVIDSLESEDEEVVKRMLNSIVQESYNLVSERLETSVEALTTAYRTNVTEDTDAVHAFENDMREQMKSDWKKDIGSLLTDDIVKETLKKVDTKDFKEDLQEIDVVTDYTKSCLRFAFSLCVQTPQFQLDSSPQPFDKNRHEREVGSGETNGSSIDYFIWPTLICNDKEKRVLKKGIVQLK